MPGPSQPYIARDEGGNARLLAYRLTYLRAVEAVAPHVVERLRVDVMPAYLAAWEESQPFVREHFWVRGWAGLTRVPDGLRGPRLPELLNALRDWATAHNLNKPWLLDTALNHLQYEVALGEALPLGSTGGNIAYWEPAQNTKPPEYRPQRQTRAEYLAAVQAYADAVEAEYAREGWKPADPPGEIVKHLLWLARRDVLGMTYDELMQAAEADTGDDNPPDQSTVRRAVKKARTAIA
jgi:hypothetical protein